MERKEAIRSAYRMTGGNNFYDGIMITCSTLSGKAVCCLVWAMNKAENDAYLEKAMSGIPEHFSGKLPVSYTHLIIIYRYHFNFPPRIHIIAHTIYTEPSPIMLSLIHISS